MTALGKFSSRPSDAAPEKQQSDVEMPASEEGSTRRVNVIFSKDQYDTLKRLANQQGINVSDALRQAINLSDLLVNLNKDPNTRILLDKGGKVQELKIVT